MRRHDRAGALRHTLVALPATIGIIVGAATSAHAAVLVLDVVVNGRDTGTVGAFTLAGRTITTTRSQLSALGIRAHCKHARCDLTTIPGLTWRIDADTQTILITVPPRRLATQQIQADASTTRYPVTNGTGAVFTYDLNTIRTGSQAMSSGLLTLRGFCADGVMTTDALVHIGSGSAWAGNAAVRLDTTYVYSAPSQLRQIRLGDFIGAGLAWSRPVRLTGIQIDSNFGLQPGLITYPLPSVAGSVAVPSTIDVMVDQSNVLSRALQPGPFEVARIPVMTGAGQIAIATTDALGRQTITTTDVYASPDLLRPGLTAYAVELGMLRLDWGTISNDYGNAVASTTLRHGLSPDLTLEAHSETTRGLLMAGGGAVMNVANRGLFGFDLAGSTNAVGPGFALVLDARHDGRRWTLGASATIARHHFTDIAAVNGQPYPDLQINATIARRFGRFGSLGIGYAEVDTPRDRQYGHGGVFGAAANVPSPTQAKIITTSYAAQAFGMAVYATGYRDIARHGDSGIMFGVTIPFGSRRSIGIQTGGTDQAGYGALQVQQVADRPGDFGYQLNQSLGAADSGFVLGRYQSSAGDIAAGIGRAGGQLITQASASGSVAWLDRHVFVSPPVNDSFAVVDTAGVAGVGVLDENRLIGRTDASGTLLVPGLTAFTANRLSIDPLDVPLNVAMPFTEATVVPNDHAGVVVRFPLSRSHAALVTVLDAHGAPMPLGSTAWLRGAAFPVGHGGAIYLTGLRVHNRVTVVTPDGARCQAGFIYHELKVPLQTIGPLQCV